MKKIKTWIKLGDLFIDEDSIRAIVKKGNFTVIEKIHGDTTVVEMDYSKVKKLVKTL